MDAASLAVFRVAFGALMIVASLRFFTHGWIDADYVRPKVFFPYWGLSFIRPWPGHGMYVHYAVMAILAALVMVGLFYRAAIVLFTLAFTWAHLCDETNYLNHYYLVSLLGFLMCFMPLDRQWSLRVVLHPDERRPQIRRWVLWLLRFQLAVVYVYGGLGKLGTDWLLHGEPLAIWLRADRELWFLRPFGDARWLPLAFSWAGLLFDLSIVPLLLWRRTRTTAYLAVLVFHALTALLFPIGMFPFIMSAGATLFFDPAWPRRWLGGVASGEPAGARLRTPAIVAVVLYATIQLVVPLRHLAYPGNTLWTEEGFRWSWRVMLVDKAGDLEFTVVDARGGRQIVPARTWLTPAQRRQASTQPDMIVQLAHRIAEDADRRGRGPAQVYADAEVAWNGRARAPLIDPTVDLARQRDSLAHKPFILPAPSTEPSP